MSLLAAWISDTQPTALIHPHTGARPTATPTVRRPLPFRQFPGTIPARAGWSLPFWESLHLGSATIPRLPVPRVRSTFSWKPSGAAAGPAAALPALHPLAESLVERALATPSRVIKQ